MDAREAPSTPAAPEHLAALAVSAGKPFRSAANAPVHFGDPATVWFVEEGAIDVFLVELSGEKVSSSFKHLLRAQAGRLLFTFPPDDDGDDGGGLAAVGKGLPGCRLRLLAIDALLAGGIAAEVAAQVDQWVGEVLVALGAALETHPPPARRVAPGDVVDAVAGTLVAARAGTVWVDAPGVALFGSEAAPAGAASLLPVTPQSWLSVGEDGALEGLSSRKLWTDGRLAAALESFHRVVLRFERMAQRIALADEANRQRSLAAHRREGVAEARRGLFELLTGLPPGASPLSLALDLVGRHEGIGFRVPAGAADDEPERAVRAVAAASGVRRRDVKLNNASRWWRGDSGAMLGFLRDTDAPVALLPGLRGYRMVDPLSGRSTGVDRAVAQQVDRTAWSFVRPLPSARVGARQIAGCAGGRLGGDLVRFLAAGLLAGLLSVVPAVVLAVVAESVLPYGDTGALLRYTGVLAGLSAAAAVLSVFQGTALMRIEGRVAARLASAVWDRVLRLRPEFFRGYAAGDLAARLAVFTSLRDKVSGTVGGPLLSLVFLTPTLLVIFAYDAPLGWLTLGLATLALAVALGFGIFQYPLHRNQLRAVRELSSELFQAITGITKLRAGGAEQAAFASWARKYRTSRPPRWGSRASTPTSSPSARRCPAWWPPCSSPTRCGRAPAWASPPSWRPTGCRRLSSRRSRGSATPSRRSRR